MSQTYQPICCNSPQLHVNLLERIQYFIQKIDAHWNYIIPPDLYKMLKSQHHPKLFLLDIRKKEDYLNSGHIPGSINIFWQDIFHRENLKKLPCPLHQPDYTIVLICYVGHTSSQTLVLLKLLGFNVVALKFGMGVSPSKEVPIKGWLDYKYPIEYTERLSPFAHDVMCQVNLV
jgi:rhodanese-related sulfurtransferase